MTASIAAAAIFFVTLGTVEAGNALRLPEIFASGMVLQRSTATPVWGWSAPDSTVRVSLGAASAGTKAGKDGKWTVSLDLSQAGAGPHELKVNELTLSDVLVGEVWLCGGQSNMEWNVGSTIDAEKVIKESANPKIRQFHVPRRPEEQPVEEVRGQWTQAGPETTAKFTAVGYHFAHKLQRELGVPIGIINATWGGSACETWMSSEGISKVEGLPAVAKHVNDDLATYPARRAEFIRTFRDWLASTGLADTRKWTPEEVLTLPEDRWSAVNLPREATPDREPGALWFRRKVEMPEQAAGKPLPLTLGNVAMLEEVWWNGERIAGTSIEDFETGRNPRKHEVPGRLVRKGTNELLVRVWSPSKTPTFGGWEAGFKAGPVFLAGQWKTVREHSHPAPATTPPEAPIELPSIQNTPSRAFNGMIAPIVPYGLAGVIWYQGEGNAARALQYHDIFPGLIADWRRLWQREDLPFFWCQLASFKKKLPTPAESAWAELREAQTKTLAVPHTGQALTLDAGEAADIHPRNKAVPGKRLADIALAKVYGRAKPVSGPAFAGVSFSEGKALVRFRETGGGLQARPVPETHILTSMPRQTEPLVRNSPNSPLEGFAICGADGVWQWADAVIAGDTVVVWNPQVPEPVAVRYAWADNPTANLFGENGLPAVPFRTDDFPLTTAGKIHP